jgi:hypothetical protein
MRKILTIAIAAVLTLAASAGSANVIGVNELDTLVKAGTPNQCYLGKSAPPSGRVSLVRGGSRVPVGSGDLTVHKNIVVTAAHLFITDAGVSRIKPGNGVVFSTWEGTPENCRLVHHEVAELIVAAKSPVREPSRDYAVLRLREPLAAYTPLRLGSAGMVGNARAGGKITIAGFAGHRSTRQGKDLSIVSCRGYPMTLWDPIWTSANSLLVFDCDTATGMSGAAITTVSGGSRYLIGVAHSSMNLSEGKPFDISSNFNFGYALEPTLGAAIACLHSGSGCRNFQSRRIVLGD